MHHHNISIAGHGSVLGMTARMIILYMVRFLQDWGYFNTKMTAADENGTKKTPFVGSTRLNSDKYLLLI